MLKESHQESDLLQQYRQVVIFEELGITFALVEQQLLVLHSSPFFFSIMISSRKLQGNHSHTS